MFTTRKFIRVTFYKYMIKKEKEEHFYNIFPVRESYDSLLNHMAFF